MLRGAVLAASIASVVTGSVTNVCVHELLRPMQDFRDFQPAMDHCALHYAGQTTTKTLANTCLTTTQTVILGTSTVHATSYMACPTAQPHIDIRDPAPLQRREEDHFFPGSEHHGDHDHDHEGEHDHDHEGEHDHVPKGTHPHTRTKEPKRTKPHTKTHYKTKTIRTHAPTHTHTPPGKTHTLPHTHTQPHTHTLPRTHTKPPHTRPHHPSQPPSYVTPRAVAKRDVAATKTAEWAEYSSSLAECGYDCIQRACSCVGTLKVVLRTPAPTCTSTLTTSTIVHETKTIEIPSANC